MFKNTQKGVSLYLALMLMSILLAIALGMSTILLGQLKMIIGMGDSVVAFYAADTGIEKVLVNRAEPTSFFDEELGNAEYDVTVTKKGEDSCSAAKYYCVKSIGTYRGTKRAIEIKY